jgi:Flp pilus assembly protein TadG
MEFGLAAPVLATMLMGVWDAGHALVVWRQVTTTAEAVATGATTLAIQPDGSAVLSPAAAQAAMSAIFANMPGLRAGIDQGAFSVTLTGVVFRDGVASTAWSVPLALGGAAPVRRPCGTLAQVSPTTPRSLDTLPTAGIANLAAAVVADVQYRFTPLFVGAITGPIPMWRMSLITPRLGPADTYVRYDVPGVGSDGAICPGYE